MFSACLWIGLQNRTFEKLRRIADGTVLPPLLKSEGLLGVSAVLNIYHRESLQRVYTDSTNYCKCALVPLCLDTEHISDYGFTVKINEPHRGDARWQERPWWKWASWRFGTAIGLFSHSLWILSRPIFNQSIIIVWHFCISRHVTGNKLLDLASSDMTERRVYYRVLKSKKVTQGRWFNYVGS